MAEKGNLFSPGFSSRCAVSPVIAGEGVFILHSFLLGVIITFIYDLFRIVRRIIPHGWFLLSLEDLAFWILATAGIFYMLYYENSGMFRWFSVIGAGVGMFLYKKTLSAPFVNLVSGAVNRLLALLGEIPVETDGSCALCLAQADGAGRKGSAQGGKGGQNTPQTGKIQVDCMEKSD